MEPANESVQQEVKNVENLLLRAKSKERVVSFTYVEDTTDQLLMGRRTPL